ncbi:hypothetical protein TNCV_2117141 [Trichonephila clavipes]|nr:hypothetical protein TNCV_2117141 [Trichonephila clavipes]
MPHVRWHQIEAYEKKGKGLDVLLSLSVTLSTMQVTGSFHTNFDREHPGGGQGLPPLFFFPQPHERAGGSTAVYSTNLPQRHYIFTNIPVYSGIRNQALRHRSQHH